MTTTSWGRSLADPGAQLPDAGDAFPETPTPPGRTAQPWTVCYAWRSTSQTAHPAYSYDDRPDSLDRALNLALRECDTPHAGLELLAAWIASEDGTWEQVQRTCNGWISGTC